MMAHSCIPIDGSSNPARQETCQGYRVRPPSLAQQGQRTAQRHPFMRAVSPLILPRPDRTWATYICSPIASQPPRSRRPLRQVHSSPPVTDHPRDSLYLPTMTLQGPDRLPPTLSTTRSLNARASSLPPPAQLPPLQRRARPQQRQA